MDNDRRRITPYQDLFDSISENKRIEVGLRSVLDMGKECHPSIREMAEAVLEEIEFFRQRKRGVYYLPYKSGKTEPTVKVEMNTNNICDPILLEMSQAVLEEMRCVRHQREIQRRCGYIFIPFFVIFFVIVVGGLLFGFTQMFKHAP